jgi:hypothetical protein
MKRRLMLFLCFLGVAALPQQAWADAGTPLMWAGAVHLLFGNALIGLGEGWLLTWLFAAPKAKTIGVMILANYVSAWLGGLFIRGAIVRALPMDLTNGWMWFWVMVAVTYVITLLIEWPFIAWCLRGTQRWLGRSLRASLVLQSTSYVLLFGWYWMSSGTSLYTRTHIVAPADLSLPESVIVYFIAPADGDVYRRSLVGGNEQKICVLGSKGDNDRLFVRPSAVDTNRWDLVARLETRDGSNPRFVDVLTNLLVEAAPDRRSSRPDPLQAEGTWFNFGEVPVLGVASNSQWKFWADFWPASGLDASKQATTEKAGFSYETPFGSWLVRNAVHLPSDKVLFQLGNDQICAFDPASQRVALLWQGRGPVPLIEKANARSGVEEQGAPRPQ